VGPSIRSVSSNLVLVLFTMLCFGDIGTPFKQDGSQIMVRLTFECQNAGIIFDERPRLNGKCCKGNIESERLHQGQPVFVMSAERLPSITASPLAHSK